VETEFIEGKLPPGHRYDFDPYLFNLPANLLLQANEGWHSFYAIRVDKKLIRAHIHFHEKEHLACSPFKNPFGSFEFSDAFTPKELFDFIKFVEHSLKKKGISKVEIKSYPHHYNPYRTALLTTFLLNNQFRIEEAELSACLDVNPSKLFESLSSWEKRKIKQQEKRNLRFKQLPDGKFHEVFHFIEVCRKERNQSLSMNLGQLENVMKAFPENFLLFGVYEDKLIAAASIAIKINKSILYNFYSAHSKQYDALSPVVGLMEGMYNFCQQENFKILDLGTSSLRGKPNFSLLDFKINMGAVPTPKLTFVKEL
jgi:lipid II:glycine glycyltransferase (peptidoglycan interpeptide bridge formation enzyme)